MIEEKKEHKDKNAVFGIFPLLLILAVGLTSCGYRINTISADQDAIAIKSSIRNPGPIAQAHCARYDRTARLQGTDLSNSQIYYFVCLDQ